MGTLRIRTGRVRLRNMMHCYRVLAWSNAVAVFAFAEFVRAVRLNITGNGVVGGTEKHLSAADRRTVLESYFAGNFDLCPAATGCKNENRNDNNGKRFHNKSRRRQPPDGQVAKSLSNK